MKYIFLLIPLAASVFTVNGFAQERIYRCGNEYTNTLPTSQTKGCKLMAGGNITVVKGTRPNAATPARGAASSAGQRVDAVEQKTRDTDARQILELELKKAQARQTELQQEYNNGQPERLGSETHNYQKYLDRAAELKTSIERNGSDIAGIRRELARLGPAAATSAAK